MITAQDPAWRTQVRTAPLDPFRGYAAAFGTSLREAVRLLDACHVVRLGKAAIDDVRRVGSRRRSSGVATATTGCTAAASCCTAAS